MGPCEGSRLVAMLNNRGGHLFYQEEESSLMWV